MSEAPPGSADPSKDPAEEQLALLTEDLGADPPDRPGTGRLLAAAVSGLLVAALLGWGLPWATGASWS
ncbi:hypothetical protein N3930_44760, partial [Bacillus thuringiensis]|nr:hypothetical protein [Bacillus thuringiensis]